jgi:hypothetical protein
MKQPIELYVVTVYSFSDYCGPNIEINDQQVRHTLPAAQTLVKTWYSKWHEDQKDYLIPEDEAARAYKDKDGWCIESCDDGYYTIFQCEIKKVEVK